MNPIACAIPVQRSESADKVTESGKLCGSVTRLNLRTEPGQALTLKLDLIFVGVEFYDFER